MDFFCRHFIVNGNFSGNLLGFISPANLVFLVIIFLLIEKIFTISIIVSQLEDKVSILSAELALRSHSSDKQISELNIDEETDLETDNE